MEWLQYGIETTIFGVIHTGEMMTLCRPCFVEEILAQQGDLGTCLQLPVEKGSDVVHYATRVDPVAITQDKFCPHCHKRLTLLKLIVADKQEKSSPEEERREELSM